MKAIKCNRVQSDAIMCNQVQSGAIGCNRVQSGAIGCNNGIHGICNTLAEANVRCTVPCFEMPPREPKQLARQRFGKGSAIQSPSPQKAHGRKPRRNYFATIGVHPYQTARPRGTALRGNTVREASGRPGDPFLEPRESRLA